MSAQYNTLADDYEWLFSDATLSGEPQVEALRPILDTLPSASRILDCACGTGILTLGLARHGYSVFGADASEGMVKVAKARAEREGLSVPFHVCAWADLPQQFDAVFDLAVCQGNSIGHCRDAQEMVRSLRGIKSVLKPTGRLVLDSRDWEMLLAQKRRFTHFGPRVRNGKRCIPIYVWNFPKTADQPFQIDVLLPIEYEGKVDLRVHPIVYQPFTYEQVHARLCEAGFSVIESNYPSPTGEYRVTARCG
jgi:glycine/sarcosine N-methyltransferase